MRFWLVVIVLIVFFILLPIGWSIFESKIQQARPAPYEWELRRENEIWPGLIAYVPRRHHMRRAHKLPSLPLVLLKCYDREGKQITPIPKGCTDLFIERDK